MSATLRYPIRTPVAGNNPYSADGSTGTVDYLKMQRFRVDYENNPSGYGGQNLPGANANPILQGSPCYLAMPPSLTASYSASYNQVEMGQIGVLAGQIAGQIAGGVGASGDKATQITGALQAAAGSLVEEAAFSAGASMVSAVADMAGTKMGASGQDFQALTKGRVMNPFTEQVFNGIGFRNHEFGFKMLARSYKEAQSILSIIKYLKKGMLPKMSQGQQMSIVKDDEGEISSMSAFVANPDNQVASYSTAGRYLEVPDRYMLTFVRHDGEMNKINDLPHYKFQPCVMTACSVNYTPDGQYVSFKDAITSLKDIKDGGDQIFVPAVDVSLSFAETKFITQGDIDAGY